MVSPTMAIEWSSKHINDWKNAVLVVQSEQAGRNRHNRTVQQGEVKWQPPEEGQLKLNVDASVVPESSYFSVGMVLRDQNGVYLRGNTMKFPSNVTAFEAEVVGLHEALLKMASNGSQPIIVETDSLLVVQALQNRRKYRLEVGTILEACQGILSSKSNLRVSHVKRLANKAAHLMARVSCSLNSYNSFEYPPRCVLETIMYESFEN